MSAMGDNVARNADMNVRALDTTCGFRLEIRVNRLWHGLCLYKGV